MTNPTASEMARMRKITKKVCPMCGKEFEGIHSKLYCGATCNSKAWRHRRSAIQKSNGEETKPVSRQIAITRIRRALAADGKRLRTCRPDSRWYTDLGDFYVTCDSNRSVLLEQHCTLEDLVEDLRVLEPNEVLEQETQR